MFYRTPTPEAVKSWRDQTGRDFVFAWKASKFITHWKRLSENSINSLELLENRLSLLGSKVGPILFQLPPNFKADADRLGKFFKMLPNKRRYSFEFRDPSWYAPRILKMLADAEHFALPVGPSRRSRAMEANGGLCLHSRSRSRRSIQRALPGEHINGMGQRIRSWKKRGNDVYVYFDNDQKSAAPADALKLRQMLSEG